MTYLDGAPIHPQGDTVSASRTKVHAKFKKGSDFELHLRTVREDGVELVELRDYIPSEKWYGRGVSFAPAQLPDVIQELAHLAQYNGGSAHPAGAHEALKQSNAAKVPGLLR